MAIGKFKRDPQRYKKLLSSKEERERRLSKFKVKPESDTDKVRRKRKYARRVSKALGSGAGASIYPKFTAKEKAASTKHLGVPVKTKKSGPTKEFAEAKKKKIDLAKIKLKKKPLPEIKAKKEKKKTKSGPHMLFGGQKVRIPGRKGGGVVMQKVRKYNEGGVVVHDQSTIKKV
jgi:hypothetical protein